MSSLESQQLDDVTMELEGFMSIQKKAMFYSGWWPVDNEPHNMLYYWRRNLLRVSFGFMSTCLVGQQVFDLILISDNLLLVFEEIIIISMGVYGLAIVWTVITKMDDHKRLVLMLQEMSQAKRLTNDFQRFLVETTEKVCYYGALFCGYSLLASIPGIFVSYFVMVFLGRLPPRQTFYRSYFPYDVTASPNYELTMCLQAMNVALLFICMMTYDSIMVTVFIHMVIQFKILRHKLKNLRTQAERNVRWKSKGNPKNTEMPCTNPTRFQSLDKSGSFNGVKKKYVATEFSKNVYLEMRRLLEECMEHHKQLLRVVNLITEISSLKLSLLTGWNLTGIIVFAIYIDLAPGIDLKQLICLDLLLLSFAELLLFSILSTQLSHESSLIGEALYFCDWVAAPEDFKRDMRIFMTTVNQPVAIVVLKFVPLSLDTWLSVMNTAYSYYTVMHELAL